MGQHRTVPADGCSGAGGGAAPGPPAAAAGRDPLLGPQLQGATSSRLPGQGGSRVSNCLWDHSFLFTSGLDT